MIFNTYDRFRKNDTIHANNSRACNPVYLEIRSDIFFVPSQRKEGKKQALQST
jgi:hypothetical protein